MQPQVFKAAGNTTCGQGQTGQQEKAYNDHRVGDAVRIDAPSKIMKEDTATKGQEDSYEKPVTLDELN